MKEKNPQKKIVCKEIGYFFKITALKYQLDLIVELQDAIIP
jgi:hypothetical protein